MALISSRNILIRRFFASIFRGEKHRPRNAVWAIHRQNLSSGELSDTTILYQNGIDIQELPLVVKKISGNKASSILFCDNNGEKSIPSSNGSDKVSGIDELPRKEEIEEMINGFKRCNSVHEVLKLLEVVPSTYVEPSVAFHIIEKMIELDYLYSIGGEGNSDDVSQNFTKTAVFNQLMGVVLSNRDSRVLIKCLELMNQHVMFKKCLVSYAEKLYEQILISVTENKFSIIELCEIVKAYHNVGNYSHIDKLWVGIAEKVDEINHDNIMNIFRILPYFKTGRSIVTSTLHKKMVDLWWRMNGEDVAEILFLTKETQTYNHEFLQILGRWMNTKIHSVTDDVLLSIIKGFGGLDFVNSEITTALERYVKIKADTLEDPYVFAGIMDYCSQFQFRSELILSKACDFFISRGRSLSVSVIRSIFVPFGNLNFVPTRSYEFWRIFEEVLEDKFACFNPEHIVEMILSCVYLEKYPINFVNNIFNPYFLNRLQASSKNWVLAKRNLMSFDHIMTLECPSYKGPLLPREHFSETLVIDGRIRTLLFQLKDTWNEIAGSYKVIYNRRLRICPVNNNCLVDVLLTPSYINLWQVEDYRNIPDPLIAVLIQLPEHYTLPQDHLIGSQVTRIRHLKKIGVKVISLKYMELLNLKTSPKILTEYISDAVNQAKSSSA